MFNQLAYNLVTLEIVPVHLEHLPSTFDLFVHVIFDICFYKFTTRIVRKTKKTKFKL